MECVPSSSQKSSSDIGTSISIKKRNTSTKIAKIVIETDEIQKLMECCLCQNYPYPKDNIGVCTDGHLTCSYCSQKIIKNQCEKKIIIEDKLQMCGNFIFKYNSSFYEYFYNNSLFKCIYHVIGCMKTTLGREIETHKKNCTYHPTIPCPFTECKNELISRVLYHNHLISSHEIFSIDSNIHRVQILHERKSQTLHRYPYPYVNDYRWVCALFNYYEQTFILITEERERNYYMWISFASDSNLVQNRKFEYRLCLVPKNHKVPVYIQCGKQDVQPINKCFEDIVTEGKCFKIRKIILDIRFVHKCGKRYFWNTDVQIQEVVPKETSSMMSELNFNDTTNDIKPEPESE